MAKLFSETFSISYDDENGDYSRHEIDADVLGKAITGVSEAVNAANKELSGEMLELKVTTPAREGSVEVVFMAIATSSAALTALKVLGITAMTGAIGTASVLEVVKQMKGKRVTRIDIDEDTDEATIEVEGEPSITTSAKVGRMAVDKKVRSSIYDFIQAPVVNNPTGVVKVLDENEQPLLQFKSDETKSFNPLPEGSLESEETQQFETTCHFTQVNFESSKGWRVKLGNGEEHPVELIDEAFMEQVKQSKKSFTKDELFGIVLEVHTIRRQTRSTHTYTVVDVTKHYAHEENRLI